MGKCLNNWTDRVNGSICYKLQQNRCMVGIVGGRGQTEMFIYAYLSMFFEHENTNITVLLQ